MELSLGESTTIYSQHSFFLSNFVLTLNSRGRIFAWEAAKLPLSLLWLVLMPNHLSAHYLLLIPPVETVLLPSKRTRLH